MNSNVLPTGPAGCPMPDMTKFPIEMIIVLYYRNVIYPIWFTIVNRPLLSDRKTIDSRYLSDNEGPVEAPMVALSRHAAPHVIRLSSYSALSALCIIKSESLFQPQRKRLVVHVRWCM